MGHGNNFVFSYQPAWLQCLGSIGLQFLLAICSTDEWNGIHFTVLLAHQLCPLCGQGEALHTSPWVHLLCSYTKAAAVGAEGGLSFLQQACQQLGLQVALCTMSHHVTGFIWLLLQHVHAQHCAQPCPVRSCSDTGSISGTSGSMDDLS